MAPRWHQDANSSRDASKMLGRCLHGPPRSRKCMHSKSVSAIVKAGARPRNGPRWPTRWAQDVPKWPMMAARWPKMAPRRPQMHQHSPKMAQGGPNMAQDGPKMTPRWPQDSFTMVPRWPQDANTPRDALNMPPRTSKKPKTRVFPRFFTGFARDPRNLDSRERKALNGRWLCQAWLSST